mmetsp:Transcript_98124/g.283083  ORF Transcript_98124/g.283083 Transcript_98124/m.283083 type:complete len:245 (+) Transcript_98124:919-1653(+)
MRQRRRGDVGRLQGGPSDLRKPGRNEGDHRHQFASQLGRREARHGRPRRGHAVLEGGAEHLHRDRQAGQCLRRAVVERDRPHPGKAQGLPRCLKGLSGRPPDLCAGWFLVHGRGVPAPPAHRRHQEGHGRREGRRRQLRRGEEGARARWAAGDGRGREAPHFPGRGALRAQPHAGSHGGLRRGSPDIRRGWRPGLRRRGVPAHQLGERAAGRRGPLGRPVRVHRGEGHLQADGLARVSGGRRPP